MAEADRGQRLAEALAAYGAAQSELGRLFARRMHLHVTDSTAVVEVIRAEGRGTPLTPGRLAERIGLTRGATSLLVNRLEAAGHVSRQRGHADRRVVTLHSAEAVHAAAREFFAPLRARTAAVMAGYGPEQLALVEELVGELGSVLEAHLRAARDQQTRDAPPTPPPDPGPVRG